MAALTALCILAAIVLVLHACATSISESEELHELAVRVHTVRNEYLTHLRGDPVEIIGDTITNTEPAANTEPIATIEPQNAAEDTESQAAAA